MPQRDYCAIGIFVLGSLVLPIFEIYGGLDIATHGQCDDDRLINPHDWMLGSGISHIALFVFIMIGMFCIPKWRGQAVGPASAGIACVFYGLFVVAWVTVGGICLWRDNLDCAPERFHDIFWAGVILRLGAVAVAACALWYSKAQSSRPFECTCTCC